MTPVQGPARHPYLRSVGDLARTQVILETLCHSGAAIDGTCVSREDEERLEEPGDHPLDPAIGIINGLRLSVVLWGVILLGVVLIW
ncbi:MAG: hypothetical protein KF751_05000 [Nitrospira sp.]|nr:hypothetical protein [Nitrospira sp.]